MLTSAVFGHLRLIPPEVFWTPLLRRARLSGTGYQNLTAWLQSKGADLSSYQHIQFDFWHMVEGYGEPDLILTFKGEGTPPVVLIVEVKLNSGKSGTGEDDQLKRYLRLLDSGEIPATRERGSLGCVVFLTRTCRVQDLEDSARLCTWSAEAHERIAGLEWNDVLEVARSEATQGHLPGGDLYRMLLNEVANFLCLRGMEAFRGFYSRHTAEAARLPQTGRFLQTGWFRLPAALPMPATGRFYA